MRIIHLIPGLGKGGAESMLFNVLANKTPKMDGVHVEVVSLGQSQYFDDRIKALGIPLHTMQIRRHPIRCLLEIRRLARDADTLCCWLYAGNFIGWLATIGQRTRLIWNIRHSNLSPKHNKRSTMFIAKLCTYLTGRVKTIAYNGEVSRKVHEAIGYPSRLSVVLDNGCDVEFYRPRDTRAIRAELRLTTDTPIVLSVARWHPLKDHETFLKALSLLKQHGRSVHIVLCGAEIEEDTTALVQLIHRQGLSKDVLLLGQRDDLPELFSLADVYVLHSLGEAVPNTLIQAMACGTSVVATDVGDVRRIMPDTCILSVPGDYEMLAGLVRRELRRSDAEGTLLRQSNRRYAEAHFSLANVISSYENCFLQSQGA